MKLSAVTGRMALMALVVLAPAVYVPAAAAAAAPLVPGVRDVAVENGVVTFTVEAETLPAGAELDPASLRVSSAEQVWAAEGVVVGDSGPAVQRRAVIAVDTSGSMGAQGISDARAAANTFLDVVPQDVAVGLVTFASEAKVVVEPGLDRQPVLTALDAMTPQGETALYDGVAVSVSALGVEGERALLLLSDGEDTTSTTTFEAAQSSLAESGVSSRLVAFRTQDTQIDVLRDMAGAQGMVIEAADGGELDDVFASSAATLVNQVVVTAQVPEGAFGDTDVTVELTAGDISLVATLTVPLPPEPVEAVPPTAAAGVTPVPAGPGWLLPAVVGFAFLCLFVLFAVALAPSTWRASPSARRAHEVERYSLAGAGRQGESQPAATPTAVGQAALAWADRRVQERGVEKSWQLLLDRAAVPLKPHEWLMLKLGVSLGGLVLGVLLLPWWLLTAPLLAALFWLSAGVYLKFRARRRAGKFAEALPDVLQLVAGSLSSGFSFPQAIDNAASEGQEPMAGELSRALAESRLGVQLEDALDHVADRMASTDLTWTVMAVRISREVGGNLAEVLLRTAGTIRERGMIRRQVKALSAEGRLSAYILIGLPIAITIWMALVRPEYLKPLVTEPLGFALTGFAILSMSFGAWVMSRLIKVEV